MYSQNMESRITLKLVLCVILTFQTSDKEITTKWSHLGKQLSISFILHN